MSGDFRSGDEKACERLRRRLIESGLVVPSARRHEPGDRPYLSPEQVETIRKRLYKLGIVKQNFGVYPETTP